jgi:hypothetical protein
VSKRKALTTVLSTLLVLLAVRPAAGEIIDSLETHSLAHLGISADVDSSIVYLDGVFVGRTPLKLDSVAAGPHVLLVFAPKEASWFGKPDSAHFLLDPGMNMDLTFQVRTPLQFKPSLVPVVSPLLQDSDGSNGRSLAIWASGGVTVVAGIAAAYYKIAADERNDSYLLTGNRALRDERRRLDTLSGIAFAAMQLGFAVFSYLLLSE